MSKVKPVMSRGRKNVDWTLCLHDSAIGRDYLPKFARGEISLRQIRQFCPNGTMIKSEIYKMEAMGVKRARSAVAKALSRRKF